MKSENSVNATNILVTCACLWKRYRLAGSKKIRYLEFSYSHHEYFVFFSQQPELREEEDFGLNNKFL